MVIDNQYERCVLKWHVSQGINFPGDVSGANVETISAQFVPRLDQMPTTEWIRFLTKAAQFKSMKFDGFTCVSKCMQPSYVVRQTATGGTFDWEMMNTQGMVFHVTRQDLNERGLLDDWFLCKEVKHTKVGNAVKNSIHMPKAWKNAWLDPRVVLAQPTNASLPNAPPNTTIEGLISANAIANGINDQTGGVSAYTRSVNGVYTVGITGIPTIVPATTGFETQINMTLTFEVYCYFLLKEKVN